MLCTPPAFILSQDQTLECLYLISPLRVSSNLSECYLSFSYFCLSCICSLRNFRVPFLHILYACTSLFVVQFSMTVSLPVFATALLLYHISFHLSIPFPKFFWLFSSFLWYAFCLATALLFYHFCLDLSIIIVFKVTQIHATSFCALCTIWRGSGIKCSQTAENIHQIGI